MPLCARLFQGNQSVIVSRTIWIMPSNIQDICSIAVWPLCLQIAKFSVSHLGLPSLLLQPVHSLLNLGRRLRRLRQRRRRRVNQPVLQAGPADVGAELCAQHRHRRRRRFRDPEARLVPHDRVGALQGADVVRGDRVPEWQFNWIISAREMAPIKA